MQTFLLSLLSVSLSVTLLFLLVTIADFFLKKSYSRRWKQFALLLLGIRLLIPVNLGVLTLPVLPLEQSGSSSSRNTLEATADQASTTIATSKESITETGISNDSITDSKADSTTDSTFDTTRSSATKSSDNQIPENSTTINTDTLHVNQAEPTAFLASSVSKRILTVCFFLWSVGCLCFLGVHLLSYKHFLRHTKENAVAVDQPDWIVLLRQELDALHITKEISLYTQNGLSTPLLVGLFHPRIILPTSTYTSEQLSFILRHELTHYKHRDLWYKFLFLFGSAIHWFNPFIYLLNKHAALTMELYCDESVIKQKPLSYREQYSLTILQILRQGTSKRQIMLSTGFTNYAKHMKERFKHIMNTKKKKRGSILLLLCILLTFVVSNIAAGQKNTKTPVDTTTNVDESLQQVQEKDSKQENNTEPASLVADTTNLLVLGLDSHDQQTAESARPDSILLLTMNKKNHTITLTTLLRDLYVTLPNGNSDKLSTAYSQYGENSVKEAIEANLDIKIDHTITFTMDGFESCIDQLGGTTITLTAKESDYLNSTNYISNKQYRNTIEGEQHLNGNQVLGYLRIRHVPTADGDNGDYGRTRRLIQVWQQISKQFFQSDLPTMLTLANKVLSTLKTDLSADETSEYLEAFLSPETTLQDNCIPCLEDCEEQVIDGKSVLVTDLEAAAIALHAYME